MNKCQSQERGVVSPMTETQRSCLFFYDWHIEATPYLYDWHWKYANANHANVNHAAAVPEQLLPSLRFTLAMSDTCADSSFCSAHWVMSVNTLCTKIHVLKVRKCVISYTAFVIAYISLKGNFFSNLLITCVPNRGGEESIRITDQQWSIALLLQCTEHYTTRYYVVI